MDYYKRIWADKREQQMKSWAIAQWTKHKRINNIRAPKNCPDCGRDFPRIEAHHPSYYHPLSVIWVCSRCHAKITRWRVAIDRIALGLPAKPTTKRVRNLPDYRWNDV